MKNTPRSYARPSRGSTGSPKSESSPIYVSVDNQPTASAADARYMLRWVDRLVEIATSESNRFPDTAARNAVLTTYTQAESRYRQIIDDAQQHWGD